MFKSKAAELNSPGRRRPLISIVIPVYNEGSLLRKTLTQLQDIRPDVELIVADGGSCDKSLNNIESLIDRLFISDASRARQMNLAASNAEGEWLLFLHADTVLPSNAVNLIKQLKVNHLWGRFDVRFSNRQWIYRVIARCMNWRSEWTGVATGDQAIFVRRDLFTRISGYQPIPLMEDVEISKRLRKHAAPVCFRSTVKTSSRRWEEYGVIYVILLMWSLRLLYFLGMSPKQLKRFY